ncbi:hypothetical protein NO2_1706, partial [Candidatus Termititenax persephonae]
SGDAGAHASNTGNPHGVTAAQVGLGSVNNTGDLDKPVSTATQTALDGKEASITAGTAAQYWRGDKTWQALDDSHTHDTRYYTETEVDTKLSGKQDNIGAATTGAAGLMSATDKTKLDGINTDTLNFFPKGTILTFSAEAWNATSATFKTVWKVCNGTGGTPDLVGKFLRGGAESSYGNTGGTNNQEISLEIKHLPSHTHIQESHSHALKSHTNSTADRVAGFGNAECRIGTAGAAQYTLTTEWYRKDYAGNELVSSETVVNENTGGNTPYAIDLPAYYTVIYIIKVV